MGGRAHLHDPGIAPVIGAEIEIAKGEGLLKNRIVRLFHDRHEDAHVVAHVVAPDLIRTVGKAVGMRRVRGAQEQERRGERTAGNHHEVGGVELLLPPRVTCTAFTVRPEGRSRALTHTRP